ncbi:MAG: 2-oxo acid dehydrogenase subunit E2 [Acidobacteriaceae bacterium]|nr:2-oxo acid dehydrogenase subunit E2 [Acidobacteriaceae bacterium]
MAKGEESRRLDWAERWVRSGLELSRPPAFFETLQADMSESRALVERARRHGVRVTYAAILVRAAALALEANPDLHVVVCGGRVHSPAQVDIAVSVAAEGALAPVMVLEGANLKKLPEVAAELAGRVEAVQKADARTMESLRKRGWAAPFGGMRKAVLRGLYRSPAFRRKSAGTFQVSIVPAVDQFITPVFGGTAVLTAGRVAERAVAENGAAVVRPTVHLACCADHRVWNGAAAGTFLRAVQEVLEGAALGAELPITND